MSIVTIELNLSLWSIFIWSCQRYKMQVLTDVISAIIGGMKDGNELPRYLDVGISGGHSTQIVNYT